MITFVDKTTSDRRYIHIHPSKSDIDGERTTLSTCNSMTSLCKSNFVGGPPSLHCWSKENLKTGEAFLLSSHIKRISLLTNCHDIESSHKSWARLSLHAEFSCKPFYWESLEDIIICCKDKLITWPNNYHVSRKSDQGNRTPYLGILSSIINVGARGYDDCQVIFDELGVAKGQYTETFITAFLSY
ncbi:LOW QUALITY PROTEIN: hypothetical protein Cgig2_003651 [Carnegiea gigantea]|uniref:Uncharacterized protein n=1 Tax=Carnegiea gigantea TaxID=171969 RepID=A0A9Q1JMJ3_9CARY|nr:LOW QUALITY PROTEIN: hypothetical protein Cgig2_003651 [Carnegiea gigantea]